MANFTLEGPDERLLGIQAVETFCGHSEKKIRLMIADGRFPRPVYRARNADKWRAIDLAAWMHLQPMLVKTDATKEDPEEDDV